MEDSKPSITLYSLQASRSIRIAFLLEELHPPYVNHSFERLPSMKAVPEFKERCGSSIGKAPVLWDGDVKVIESGAITEYLLEKYDQSGNLSGKHSARTRQRVLTFIHAAEGTFMVHCLATTYARAFAPESVRSSGALREMERGFAINVGADLDWLENELRQNDEEEVAVEWGEVGDGGGGGELGGDGGGGGELGEGGGGGELGDGGGRGEDGGEEGYLVGKEFTAADTMVLFSIQYIFKKDLCAGRKMDEWHRVKRWVERCERREGYKRAVKKTGFEL